MSKIVIKNKREKITIINRLSYPETVNERVNNAITSGMLQGFLPLIINQKRKKIRIECSVQGLLTLNQYFEGEVSKNAFLDFVYRIVTIVKNCEKNMISANNLDLQKDYIFVDPITKAVKCIYWPVVNNQRSTPPNLFLKQLPYDISFNQHEDNFYLEQYAKFFDGYTPFSVNEFERLLLKLQGKTFGSSRNPSVTPSGKLSNVKKVKTNYQENSKIEYDPISESEESRQLKSELKQPMYTDCIFCAECGEKNKVIANFCSACGHKLNIPAKNIHLVHPTSSIGFMEYETTVLGQEMGGTVVLEYDRVDKQVYPTILRNKTGESFVVDKSVFRIGTEQSYCDLLISDNTYISRSHADIISKNGHYFVVDKNSTNRTFVDGKVIASETEVEIFDGTAIKLANEEFLFSLE